MAAESGHPTDHLTERLSKEPFRFDFFRAVRLLENNCAEYPRQRQTPRPAAPEAASLGNSDFENVVREECHGLKTTDYLEQNQRSARHDSASGCGFPKKPRLSVNDFWLENE